MPSRSTLSSLSLLTALALAACGDTAPAPVAYDDFGAAYVAATCDFAARCPVAGYEGGGYAELAAMPREECLEVIGRSIAEGLPYDASIASGTITFDEDAAGACIHSLNQGCGGPLLVNISPSCITMFQGTVAVGGSCTIDADCADGGNCMRTEVATCGGVCVAAPALGAACSATEPCSRLSAEDGQPLHCVTTSASAAAHCAPVQPRVVTRGATCGQLEGDGDEVTFAVCPSNTYCRMTSATTGTCETPLERDASCSAAIDACAVGDECDVLPGATGFCREWPEPVSEGGACSALMICNAAIDLVCVEGVCQQRVQGGVGAECVIGTDGCEDGLYCQGDGVSPTVCARLLPAGAECGATGHESCESGFCDYSVDPAVCDPVELICF